MEHFGKYFGDMKNDADNEHGLYAIVLCEGCGPIQVDREGSCISEDCLCEGHKAPMEEWWDLREKNMKRQKEGKE
jgi:hypothetical protein